MNMVRLNRELREAHTETLLRDSKCRKDQGCKGSLTEAREPLPELHRDVHGVSLLELRTPNVRNAGFRP
jgi:hypothetical protein